MSEDSGKFLVLSGVAIVTLAVIVLMGIAVTQGFSKVLRDETIDRNVTLTIGALNSPTEFSAYPFMQALTGCHNESGETINVAKVNASGVNVTWAEGTAAGAVLTAMEANLALEELNCTVTSLQDTTEQGSADTFVTGLAVFGTFAAVIVLALVGIVIIGLFRRKD